jgi:NADH dehydrogenase/NADH:ubiquinone oxidoreductase subunit G
LVPAAIATAQPNTSTTAATNAVAAAAKELAADLKEARELLKKVTDKTTRDRLELLITRSELKALEMEKLLSGMHVATTQPAAMSAENFAKLLKALKAEAFDDGKTSFVATFAVQGRLNCEQARELLKVFSFDEGRIKSAEVLYPRLTDPEKFYTVLDVFSFDSSRTEVRKKLNLKK